MDLFVGLWLHDQQTTEREKSSDLGYLKMPSSYKSVFWKIIYLYLFWNILWRSQAERDEILKNI